MKDRIVQILETGTVGASAPCRIDMGGTLDIRTLHYPLRRLRPCTFNIAVGLRTTVRLLPFEPGAVKVSSRGFDSVVYPVDSAPFDHSLGLIFAIAAYFGIGGVHISIASASPPRSALGGSSAASVALVGAYNDLLGRAGRPPMNRRQIVRLAHILEESVAGVPCGLQDQLAAAYGGVNVWQWPGEIDQPAFVREPVIAADAFAGLRRRLLIAYCGIPHVSKDINGRWMRQFLSGRFRNHWTAIAGCTRDFAAAVAHCDYPRAAALMLQETGLRREMTPEVLDEMGADLVDAAAAAGCGARFTGAGGGGCLWAIGEAADIGRLQKRWQALLAGRTQARLLDAPIDGDGLVGFGP